MTHPPGTPERVAADLEARIRSGELPAGTRMPSRRELGRDVGDYVARRALTLLAARGLVVTRRRGATVVADVLPAPLLSTDERLASVESEVRDLRARLDRLEGR